MGWILVAGELIIRILDLVAADEAAMGYIRTLEGDLGFGVTPTQAPNAAVESQASGTDDRIQR